MRVGPFESCGLCLFLALGACGSSSGGAGGVGAGGQGGGSVAGGSSAGASGSAGANLGGNGVGGTSNTAGAGGTGATAGAGGTGGGTAGGGGAGPTVTITASIAEWVSPSMTGDKIADATVCLWATPPTNCTTTDTAGAFALSGVPALSDVGIVITKAGHVRTNIFLHSPSTNLIGGTVGIITDAIGQKKCATGGGTWPLQGTGIVEIGSFVPSGNMVLPAAMVTVTLGPKSGVGPVYLGADGYPDTTLSSTSAEGGVFFLNVTPGNVVLSMTMAGKKCVIPTDGWAGPSPGSVSLPAEADTLTYMSILCQ